MSQLKSLQKQFLAINDGPIWIYETLSSKLNAINEDNAFVRPLPSLLSVAEIIDHITYWRDSSTCKLKGDKIGRNDWTPIEKLQEKGWNTMLKELNISTKAFSSCLEENDDFLEETYYDNDYKQEFNKQFLIEGVIQHDLYHLGQLGIIINHLKQIDAA